MCKESTNNGMWRSLASALVLGTRGRRFKSCHPDKVECMLTFQVDMHFLMIKKGTQKHPYTKIQPKTSITLGCIGSLEITRLYLKNLIPHSTVVIYYLIPIIKTIDNIVVVLNMGSNDLIFDNPVFAFITTGTHK